MVQSAVTNVIGPAIAADDPDALLDQRIGQYSADRGHRGCPTDRRSLSLSNSTRSRCLRDALLQSTDLPRQSQSASSCADRYRRAASTSSRAYSFCLSTARGACPGQTRRCLRTSELVQAGRGLRRLTCRAWSAGCRRRSRNSRWRWRSIARSPKSCVISLMYGVSPQPEQAPENSNSGCSSCTSFT